MKENCNRDKTWIPPEQSEDHAKDLKVIFVVIVKEGTALHRIQMAETSKMIDSTTFHKHYTRLNIVITEL